MKEFKSIYHKIMVQNLYKLGLINVSIPQEAKCFDSPIFHSNNTDFITPQKILDLFLFSLLLTRTNPTIYWDATIQSLILHLIPFQVLYIYFESYSSNVSNVFIFVMTYCCDNIFIPSFYFFMLTMITYLASIRQILQSQYQLFHLSFFQ